MNEEHFIEVTKLHSNVLNTLCTIINDWATKKGWNETPDSVSHKAEQIALMHSELSEALEAIRTKPKILCPVCQLPMIQSSLDEHLFDCQQGVKCRNTRVVTDAELHYMDDKVPTLTGEAAELADVLIRIFHYCGKRGIDLGEAVRLKHEFNITRPYKHGKKI